MEEDYKLTLFDRIEMIKTTIKTYGEDNFYIGFSGGKDSTILHYLIDMAIPNNNIKRVYIDTGIDLMAIREYVSEMKKNDSRIIMIKPTLPVKKTLEIYGYPFKSKIHSHNLAIYQHGGKSKCIKVYLARNKKSKFKCPDMLLYQFEEKSKVKYSEKCCIKMKEEPIKKWAKENNKLINITGMRREEGGRRQNITCILTDKKSGNVKKFNPLAPVTDEFEDWFVNEYKIKLCKLYYPPYNFKRTGCKGCPFNNNLQDELDTLFKYFINEEKQCEIIWKPVYAEYRRIGYRLKNYSQMKLF